MLDGLTGLAQCHSRVGCNAGCHEDVHAHVFEALTADPTELREWLERDIPDIDIIEVRYAPEAKRPDHIEIVDVLDIDARRPWAFKDSETHPHLVIFRMEDFEARVGAAA